MVLVPNGEQLTPLLYSIYNSNNKSKNALKGHFFIALFYKLHTIYNVNKMCFKRGL